MSAPLASSTALSSVAYSLPASPPAQTANFQPGTPRETLISESLIQEIAVRALKLSAPTSVLGAPIYYAPSNTSNFMTAESAHILRTARDCFRALIPIRQLKDEMFRTVHEGILYDHATKIAKKVAIRALQARMNSRSTELNHSHSIHREITDLIKSSHAQASVFITEPSIPFGPLWISQIPLCNLHEATLGKHANETPPPPQQWLGRIQEVALTLNWLHSKGLIYGEVTLENIVLMASEADSNTPLRARLQSFDYCMPRGYSDVGLALEDPCSHFSIAMPLTDTYGLAATLAILFSDPKRPITGAFLEEECIKYITEFLQTGKIADLDVPSKYPFERAIKLICYEQMSVIFSILRSRPLDREHLLSVPLRILKKKQLPNGKRTWELNPRSVEEVLEAYPNYQTFFTKDTIEWAEVAIAEKFKKEGVPRVRLPDLLKAAEALIKQREQEEKEKSEAQALLFPQQQLQAARSGTTATTAISSPPKNPILKESSSERELREAKELLFPAQQHPQTTRARPSTVSQTQGQDLPYASEVSFMIAAARERSGVVSSAVQIQSKALESVSASASATTTNVLQRVPLMQRYPLPRSEGRTEEGHLGSPQRLRGHTPAAGSRQQAQGDVVTHPVYGTFKNPSSNSPSGVQPRILRRPTPGPGAGNYGTIEKK